MAFCKYCFGLGEKYYCSGQKATPECYYHGTPDTGKCKLYKPFSLFDFHNRSEKPDPNSVVNSSSKDESANPYWERIEALSKAQRDKGIEKYEQGLEVNTTHSIVERLTYIEEELIDALMYIEWVKDGLAGKGK